MQVTPPIPIPITPKAPDRTPNTILWHTLRKYWITALMTALVVIAGSVFYTLGLKKIYQAQGTILFDPNPPRPLGHRVENVVEMGNSGFWDNQEYYETQYHLIRSRRVALEVVSDLGLQNDSAFIENLPPGKKSELGTKVEPMIAAEILRGRITVNAVRNSRLAQVSFKDANPERAQRLVKAVLDTYVRQNLQTAMESTGSATDWLRSQLDTLKTDLESSELALHQYKKDKDILSVAYDDKSNMLTAEMQAINTELTRVRALQQQVAARKSVLSTVPENDPSLIQSSELLKSPLLNSLRVEYEQAVRHRDGLMGSGKAKKHPEVAAARRKVKAARKAILAEIRNVKKAVDRDLAVLSRTAGGLHGMLNKSKEQAHDLNLLEIEYNRLSRTKDNTEKLYSLVLERTKEADLTRMIQINNVSVVDEPLRPMGSIYPKVPLNIMIGIFGGLILGVAAAFARGMLDRTIKTPDEIETDLNATVLGLLPQLEGHAAKKRQKKRYRGRPMPEGSSELIVHNDPLSSASEAARAVRTNLMFMSPDKPYEMLLVTSAAPSEGKTTVACCIAIAMAQVGQKVCIVDCDLRRPRLHRVFGVTNTEGVSSAILGDDIDDVVKETRIPNLSIIPSGPVPPNPAELFHAKRFKELVKDLRKKFDRVIIDSSPVAVVTDSVILSTIVDGVVLVTRAFKTRKELAKHAVRSVRDVGGNLAGVVLNDVDFDRSEYKYNYYYYRRDEYALDEQETIANDVEDHRDQPAAE